MSCIKNCVYRFLDKNGNVLYVGSTQNSLSARIGQHSCNGHLLGKCYDDTASIEYIMLPTKADRKIAELYFINKYQPLYNTYEKDELGISFNIQFLECLTWKKYKGFVSFLKTKEDRERPDFFAIMRRTYEQLKIIEQEQIMENEEEK